MSSTTTPTVTFDPARYGRIARDIAAKRGYLRLTGRSFGPEDIEQAALLELVERLDRYDASLGEFEPWAREVMLRGIKHFVRKNTRTVRVPASAQVAREMGADGDGATFVHAPYHERSIDAAVSNDDCLSLHELLGAPDDIDGVERRDELRALLDDLEPAHSLVLRELLRGQTQQELAGRLGVTRQRISQVKAEALDVLSKRR